VTGLDLRLLVLLEHNSEVIANRLGSVEIGCR
jgi:hypothetical protein